MGFKIFKTREDAIKANSDAATQALRDAAEASKRGDAAAVRRHLEWYQDCDTTAKHFADGDYDDVIENP